MNTDDYLFFGPRDYKIKNTTKFYPFVEGEIKPLPPLRDINDMLRDFKFDFTPDKFIPATKPVSEAAQRLFDRWNVHLSRWTDDVRAHAKYRPEPRWKLNLDVLPDALDYLGLTWEVQINQLHTWFGLGAHYGALGDSLFDPNLHKITEQVHVLSVDPGLKPVAASMTLWHELTHAKQAQQYDSPWAFYQKIRGEIRSVGIGTPQYFDLWFETEAFTNMDLHFEIGSLAVPA